MMEYPDMRPHKKFLRCNYFRRNAARNRWFFHSKNLRSMKVRTPVTVMKASLDMLEREGIHSKYLDLKEGDEVVECETV